MPAQLNDSGSFSPDSGAVDDLMPKSTASLVVDPSTVDGLSDYQPGDTVNLTVKCKYTPPDKSGMSEMDVISVKAEPMDGGAKIHRQRMAQAGVGDSSMPTGMNG